MNSHMGYVYTVFEDQLCRSLELVSYEDFCKDYGWTGYLWIIDNDSVT